MKYQVLGLFTLSLWWWFVRVDESA